MNVGLSSGVFVLLTVRMSNNIEKFDLLKNEENVSLLLLKKKNEINQAILFFISNHIKNSKIKNIQIIGIFLKYFFFVSIRITLDMKLAANII